MENQDNVQSPKPNPNPFPTTFVQADTTSFKQVVQMLTGSAETAVAAAAANPNPPPPPPPPPKNSMGPKKPSFKALYERRNNIKNLNIVSCPFAPNMFPPRKQPEILSPSILDFPSLVLSPVTPLIPDPFLRTSASTTGSTSDSTARTLLLSEEEKAIADKGFYLHPSPRSSKDAEAPRLLPLFPVTSPRVSRNSSSSSSSSSSSCTCSNSHSGVV